MPACLHPNSYVCLTGVASLSMASGNHKNPAFPMMAGSHVLAALLYDQNPEGRNEGLARG